MKDLTVHLTATGQVLLDQVNLHLKPGTVNGLMGRSGTGKSTLVRGISTYRKNRFEKLVSLIFPAAGLTNI